MSLEDKLARAQERIAFLERAISKQNSEIEQTLAQAIGCYPWYKDDQVNFPGATVAHGVCIGEHVAETLAMEAARLIRSLRSERDKAQTELERLKADGSAK
jgi:hypothetical protein